MAGGKRLNCDNVRDAEAVAAELWEQEQRQMVTGLLQLTPTEAQRLELPLDEDH